MAKRGSRPELYKIEKTTILATIRKQAGLSQKTVAMFFGMDGELQSRRNIALH